MSIYFDQHVNCRIRVNSQRSVGGFASYLPIRFFEGETKNFIVSKNKYN